MFCVDGFGICGAYSKGYCGVENANNPDPCIFTQYPLEIELFLDSNILKDIACVGYSGISNYILPLSLQVFC